MIVVDASAAVAGLLRAGQARTAMGGQQVHVPHLIDSELAHVLRRLVRGGHLEADAGWGALAVWQRLGVIRYPAFTLLDRVWELRDNATAYDAAYVALAENLGCDLVTPDARLARVPGVRCSVTVVPG